MLTTYFYLGLKFRPRLSIFWRKGPKDRLIFGWRRTLDPGANGAHGFGQIIAPWQGEAWFAGRDPEVDVYALNHPIIRGIPIVR